MKISILNLKKNSKEEILTAGKPWPLAFRALAFLLIITFTVTQIGWAYETQPVDFYSDPQAVRTIPLQDLSQESDTDSSETLQQTSTDFLENTLSLTSAETGPQIFEAEAMQKTTGGETPDGSGWNLWSNGEIYQRLDDLEAGIYEIEVIANGQSANGIAPLMNVKVDTLKAGSSISVQALASGYESYKIQNVKISTASRRLSVQFTNDECCADGDRNLLIDKVILRKTGELPVTVGFTLEAETMQATVGAPMVDGTGWVLWANGELAGTRSVTEGGLYDIEIPAYGMLAGGIAPLMEIKIDGKKIAAPISVGTHDWDFQTYRIRDVRLEAGEHRFSIAFLNDACCEEGDRNLFVDKLTIQKTGALPNPQNFSIEAEAMRAANGAPTEDERGWLLWSNGEMTKPAEFMESGIYEVTVLAYGTEAGGISPLMDVRIDGARVAQGISVSPADGVYQPYVISNLEIEAGMHDIALLFTNDACCAEGDRNLFVDKIQFRKIAEIPVNPDETKMKARDMQKTTGGPNDDGKGWIIWSNGEVFDTRDLADGFYDIEVTAYGQEAGGILPLMDIKVDDVKIAPSVSVQSHGGNYQSYQFSEVALAAGVHKFAAVFINDDCCAQGDRNLFIEKITIRKTGGSAPQVEWVSPAVSGDPVYELVYRVNGSENRERRILKEGVNTITVAQMNASGELVTARYAVTYQPAAGESQKLDAVSEAGDIFHYEDEALRAVRLKDGTLVSHIRLGAGGNLEEALVTFADGSIQYFEKGDLALYLKPDGSQFFYENGSLRRAVTHQGESVSYDYEKDAEENIIKITVEADRFRAEYDGEGRILQRYDKIKRITTDYEEGILLSVTGPDGSELQHRITRTEGLISSEPHQFKNAAGIWTPFQASPEQTAYADYVFLRYHASDATLESARHKDGSLYVFDQGALTEITDASGEKIQLSEVSTSALSNVTELLVTQQGLSLTYDGSGLLKSILTAQAADGEARKIHFDPAGKIIQIEKDDGTLVTDLVFDAAGNLEDAVFITAGKDQRIYRNKQMVKETKADGSETDFVNGRPVTTHLADGRTYHYEVLANGETRSVLTEYVLNNGNRVKLAGGKPVKIEQPDGTVLEDLLFGPSGILLEARLKRLSEGQTIWTGIYRNGELKEINFPDGKKFIYEDKKLIRSVSAEEGGTDISCRYDSRGEILSYTQQNEFGVKTFDAQGQLTQFQTESFTAFYESGVLRRLAYAHVTVDDPVFDAQGQLSHGTLRGNDGFVYRLHNGALYEVTRPDGLTVQYQNARVSEVRTASKSVRYVYTDDAFGNIRDVWVDVNTGSGWTRRAFSEYLAENNQDYKPFTADSYDLTTAFRTYLRVHALEPDGTDSYLFKGPAQNPADGETKYVFDSASFLSLQGVRTGINLDLYDFNKPSGSGMPVLSRDGFLYLRLKQGAGDPFLVRPYWNVAGIAEPVPAGPPLALTETYQDFVIPVPAIEGGADLATNLRLNFEPPMEPEAVWSFSIAEVMYYKFETKIPSDYQSLLFLSPAAVQSAVQAAEGLNVMGFLDGESLVPFLNHLEASRGFAAEMMYDGDFNLTRSVRFDGSTVQYQGQATESLLKDGSRVFYTYEAGELIRTVTKNADASKPDIITEYQHGKIRRVTEASGKLLYTYVYEVLNDGNVFTLITDEQTGEVKRYHEEQLLSSRAADGLETVYTYQSGRIKTSETRRSGKTLNHFKYAYEGETILITDGEGVTRTYDAQNQLLFLKTPEGLTYRYDRLHDEDNHPIEQQLLYSADAGNGTTLFYKEDQVSKIVLKDGTVLNVAENDPDLYEKVLIKQGLVDQVLLKTGETAFYLRDDLGRLTEVRVVKDGITKTYTAEGRLKSRVNPDGTALYYGYLTDEQGRIQKTRVVKRTPVAVAGSFLPFNEASQEFSRMRVMSAGYIDGWNTALFLDDEGLGHFNYNYWEQGRNWQGRGYDIAVVDAQGRPVKSELFDVWGKGSSEAERMAGFLESVAEGHYILLSVGDEGALHMTERAYKAIEAFGSAQIRNLRFRGSYALIGKKGAAVGTVLEEVRDMGEGPAEVQSYQTEYAYYDEAGQPIAYDEFTAVPNRTWASLYQADTGDRAEVLAVTESGQTAAYRKNFNSFYPESGFVRLWNGMTNAPSPDQIQDLNLLAGSAKKKVVYFDADYPSSIPSNGRAMVLRNSLQALGFEAVDARGLAEVMKNSGPETVIVMAQDVIPDTVYDPLSPFSISTREIPQDFMRAGGTLIWPFEMPFFYVGRSGQTKDFVGEIGAKNVLGVTPLTRYTQIKTEKRETFDAVPPGWNLSPSASLDQGVLRLSANPLEPYAIDSGEWTAAQKLPEISVDFKNGTENSGLRVSFQNQNGGNPLEIVQEMDAFWAVSGDGEPVRLTPLEWDPFQEYTVTFKLNSLAQPELYFYEKGGMPPAAPQLKLNTAWGGVRLAASIASGHADLNEVRFKALGGTASLSGITQKPSFAVPENQPALDFSELYFDTNINARQIRWNKIAESIGYSLKSDTTVIADYDGVSGDVLSITKADRTVTFYEAQKEQYVADINGNILAEYFYDTEGNLSRVYNAGGRRDLDYAHLDAQIKAERERFFILADFAVQRQIIIDDTLQTIEEQRQALYGARSQLVNQLNDLEGQKMKGSKAKKEKSHALDRIRDEIRKVDETIRQFEVDASAMMVTVYEQLAEKETELKTQVSAALEELEIQFDKQKETMLLEEARPVIYDVYRRVMGRDPSKLEVQSLNAQVLAAGRLDTAALSGSIRSSFEFSVRTERVHRIRSAIEDSLDGYFQAAGPERLARIHALGLSAADVIELTSSDISSLKNYLLGQSLHFGESAIDSLIQMLAAQGLAELSDEAFRDRIAEELILTDILTGVLHGELEGELLISLAALKHAAARYGLPAEAFRLDYAGLKAAHLADPSARILIHVNGNHYLTVKEVRDGEIVLFDSSAGGQGAEVTLSKNEFLESWQGIALVSDADFKEANADKRISYEQTRQIKGAFFWIIPGIIAAISAVVGAIASLLAGIAAIIAGIGQIIANVFIALGNIIGGLAQGIGTLVKAVFSGIQYVGAQLFKGFTSFYSSFASKSIFAGFKLPAANKLFQFAIKQGLTYLANKGLSQLGLNPVLSNILSAFVTGGIQGGFTKTGLDFAAFLSSGLKSGLLSGAQTLIDKLQLNPVLSGVIGMTSQALVNGIWSGQIQGELIKIAPQVTKNLVQYGIQKLINAGGLNQTLGSLLGAPLASTAADLVTGLLNPNGGGGPGWGKFFAEKIQGLISEELTIAAKYYLEKLKLPAGLSGILGTTAEALIQAVSDNDAQTTLASVFKKNAGSLLKELTSYGVSELGKRIKSPALSAAAVGLASSLADAVLNRKSLDPDGVWKTLADFAQAGFEEIADDLNMPQQIKTFLSQLTGDIKAAASDDDPETDLLSVLKASGPDFLRALSAYGIDRFGLYEHLGSGAKDALNQFLDAVIEGRPLDEVLWTNLEAFALSGVTSLSNRLNLSQDTASLLGESASGLLKALSDSDAATTAESVLKDKLPALLKSFALSGFSNLSRSLELKTDLAAVMQGSFSRFYDALSGSQTMDAALSGIFRDWLQLGLEKLETKAEGAAESLGKRLHLPASLTGILKTIFGEIASGGSPASVLSAHAEELKKELLRFGTQKAIQALDLKEGLAQDLNDLLEAYLAGTPLDQAAWSKLQEVVLESVEKLAQRFNFPPSLAEVLSDTALQITEAAKKGKFSDIGSIVAGNLKNVSAEFAAYGAVRLGEKLGIDSGKFQAAIADGVRALVMGESLESVFWGHSADFVELALEKLNGAALPEDLSALIREIAQALEAAKTDDDPQTDEASVFKQFAPQLIKLLAQKGTFWAAGTLGLNADLAATAAAAVESYLNGESLTDVLKAHLQDFLVYGWNEVKEFVQDQKWISKTLDALGVNLDEVSVEEIQKMAGLLSGKEDLISALLKKLDPDLLVSGASAQAKAEVDSAMIEDYTLNLGDEDFKESLLGHLEDFLGPQGLEEVVTKGIDEIVNRALTKIGLDTGDEADELRITDSVSLYFNSKGTLIGRKKGDKTDVGTFGKNRDGKTGLKDGTTFVKQEDGFSAEALVKAGLISQIEIEKAQREVLKLMGGTKMLLWTNSGWIHQGTLIQNDEVRFDFDKNTVKNIWNKVTQTVGALFSEKTVEKGKRTYFLNGVGNQGCKEIGYPQSADTPCYAYALADALAKVPEAGQYHLDKASFQHIPLFLGTNAAAGFVSLQSEIFRLTEENTQKVIQQIRADLAAGVIRDHEVVNIIAYSGGGDIFMNAIQDAGLKIRVNLVTLGVPFFTIKSSSKIESFLYMMGTDDFLFLPSLLSFSTLQTQKRLLESQRKKHKEEILQGYAHNKLIIDQSYFSTAPYLYAGSAVPISYIDFMVRKIFGFFKGAV